MDVCRGAQCEGGVEWLLLIDKLVWVSYHVYYLLAVDDCRRVDCGDGVENDCCLSRNWFGYSRYTNVKYITC